MEVTNMKNAEFKINTTKRNIIIAVVVIMVAAMAGIFVGCKAHNTNSDANVVTENITSEVVEESTTPAPTEEPTSTPEATVEPSEEPTSTPEVSEEPTSTPNPTEAPEATEEPESTPAPTEEPKPTEEPTPEPTEPPHTHNYSASVTQPTCTTQGYTTYTCSCGDSYNDDYTTGSHNYSNGTCTTCGASDPNYIPPHTHSWTEHTWTEDVVTETEISVYVCNGCGSEFSDYPSLEAHQASTGWDGTPAHTGWHNKYNWVETITQIIHHYRECACGAREDID